MRRERHRKARLLGDVLRHNRRRGLIHLQPAVLLRNIDRRQPKIRSLLQQPPRNGKILRLNLIRRRHNLVDGKVRRRLSNLLLLVSEILREKSSQRQSGSVMRKLPPGIRFVSAIGAVIVAMVLPRFRKSFQLNQLRNYWIPIEKLSIERRTVCPSSEPSAPVWTRSRPTLDPDRNAVVPIHSLCSAPTHPPGKAWLPRTDC